MDVGEVVRVACEVALFLVGIFGGKRIERRKQRKRAEALTAPPPPAYRG